MKSAFHDEDNDLQDEVGAKIEGGSVSYKGKKVTVKKRPEKKKKLTKKQMEINY